MTIGGLQKLTLIDFPGHIAATVFTVGCNFRCPFCHNPELVSGAKHSASNVLEKEFFDLLKSRQGKLEGVCITGGEPTIQPDLIEFIRKIKNSGFKVKLDTNGTRPDVLRLLYAEKLLDFVAMDIKNYPEKYAETANSKIYPVRKRIKDDKSNNAKEKQYSMGFSNGVDMERIRLSVDLIRNSGVDYEFRTTAVPGLHKKSDFASIGEWLKGSKKYVLQAFEDKGKILDPNLVKKTKGKRLNLEKIAKNIEKYFGKVEIR
ncbi:MAG: anaerobic ribonucleoside-triphosphate reductase activating protein [Parcubacteria group bacterium]|jgi:pyruvate formate lyase activating enzyme